MIRLVRYFRYFLVLILTFQFECFGSFISGQDLAPPLDIPLTLSSNFGELRPNQFHFGLDIKTEGITGLDVHAIDSGYVSRIKIEPGGYGRALYITHPNGYTSVYAHLKSFREDIEQYCQDEQYKEKKFHVDLTVPPGKLKVAKNEIIALSGNAGYTTGPHLHFEIRNTETQTTLNVLRLFHFDIADTIPPLFSHLWIYPFLEDSIISQVEPPVRYDPVKADSLWKLKNDSIIEVPHRFAFGLSAYDLLNHSLNKTSIYRIQLRVGHQPVYEQRITSLSWKEMRYVNSLMDYGYYHKHDIRINRLYLQPNNILTIYHHVMNRGIITLSDTLPKEVRIRIQDAAGNASVLKFRIQCRNLARSNRDSVLVAERRILYYNRDNHLKDTGIRLDIPKNALYDNMVFDYHRVPDQTHYYSDIFQILNSCVPLQIPAKLSIVPRHVPVTYLGKLILVRLNKRNQVAWCGGAYKNGSVEAGIRTFGNFTVAVDTVPPTLKLLKDHVSKGNYSDESEIRFYVSDDLSGISSFNGYIDGKWALFQYDLKENLIYYRFDPDRMKFGRKHSLELQVTDAKGNQTTFRDTFFK